MSKLFAKEPIIISNRYRKFKKAGLILSHERMFDTAKGFLGALKLVYINTLDTHVNIKCATFY